MSASLQQHGIKEVYKQRCLQVKNSSMDTIKVLINCQAEKYIHSFTGSSEQMVKAEQFLAAWA